MISFPFSSFFLFCLWSINRAHSVLLFQSVSDSQSLRPLAPGARAASPRKNVVCVVENALSAFSTTHTTSGERRRCEQAIVMGIRHALNDQRRLFFCFYCFFSLCGNGGLRAAVAYEAGGDDCDCRQGNADMEGILKRQDARLPLYQPTDHLNRGRKGSACRCSSRHEERLSARPELSERRRWRDLLGQVRRM